MIAQKQFREDLYYRLSVFPIVLPNLEDRQEDILPLAQHFLEVMSGKYGKAITQISSPAANLLQSYSWPGNVRELENCMERAVITVTDNCIHSYNLPAALQDENVGEDIRMPESQSPERLEAKVAAFIRQQLELALKKHAGNKSMAGKELGLSPRMMNYYMNKAGMDG